MQDKVLIEKDDGIGIIYLNDPERLNPLSIELREGLLRAILDFDLDNSIYAVVITGKSRGFCAGGDIRSMENKTSIIKGKEGFETVTRIIQTMVNMKKPVIAAVHGFAAGAGFSLSLASDIVIAEKNTKFTLAFKKLDLVPDLGLHYFLPRIVGIWKAKKLIWSAGEISAEEGYKYGFVTEVVEKGEGLQRAIELAKELAQGPLQVYYHSKKLINKSLSMDIDDVLSTEGYVQSILKETEDHNEGIKAFRDKRTPNFKGK